ncbi:MAG: 3-hydroxyisobutyrate dehydrogenase [Hyphomicrobiaceae bacterium]
MANIAFIGLGNMGGPMSANLVKGQHNVRGYDLVADLRAAAEREGVQIASSAQDAVKGAEVVITMLPQGQHVLSVWRDIIAAVPSGALMIDCSTIDVASAREAHAIAAARGLDAVDAPVSGGTTGAKAATLTLMVGGSEQAVARARPILEKVGSRVVHCGEAGLGQAAKICNNMMAGINMVAAAEGFALAERLGLSAQALFDVVSTSSGQSAGVTGYCPVPGLVERAASNNDYQPGFALALMLKDLKLAQSAAASVGATSPMGALAVQLYALHALAGQGGKDFSHIYTMIRGAGH